MKKYSKYSLPILLLLMAAGLVNVSCADEDLSNNANDRNGVSFAVSDVQDAPDADLPTLTKSKEAYLTRSINFNEAGTADMCLQESTVPGVNPMKRTPQTRAWLKNTIDANFGAFACQNGSAGPDYFDNEQVTPSGQMLQPKSWGSTASTMKFYAVYPYMDGTNAQQKLVYPTTGSLPYVEFEASTDIANQTDLMTAETATINYTATGGAPHVVPLKFYHALTAIRFGVGQNLSWEKTIKSIEFQGIYKAGHFDLATKAWSHQSGTQNFKLDNINKSTSGTLNTVIVKDGNTFLMVPQTLPSGAKIVITFADNSHITANIGGKIWAAGTTKTYMMTEKNSSWEYKIETTDPAVIAYDQTTSTTPYTVKSYRQAPGGTEQQPVKWKVVSYQESTDGGLHWSAESETKPTWLTNLTLESGDGGTAAESGSVTLQAATLIDKFAERNKVLHDAPAKGSTGNYYDLSIHDYKGNVTQRNTANSYLISAPGYYKIPLVYGNAIKNNATNTSSYQTSVSGTYVLQHFKDHAGQNITDPWITQSNGGNNAPDNAKLVWADESGLVTNLSVTGSGTNAFVQFEVPAANIKNGNAVIAVTKGGTVVWSWHLWFAPQDALNTTACTSFWSKVYNFINETLGWKYTAWKSTTYSAPRKVKVRVRQLAKNGANYKESTITITQNNGNVRQGYATLYQFGRKDAMPGTDTTPDGSFNENGGNNTSIQNGIQHPETFYIWGSNYDQYNLWSMDNTATGFNDNPVVKTIYDPCPAGFQMPASNAFKFTTNGNNTNTQSEFNINGAWDYGWNFNNKNINPDATVYFPASGYRDSNDGSLYLVGTTGCYWSAVPYDTYSGCRLVFSPALVSPKHFLRRSNAFAVRPVAE